LVAELPKVDTSTSMYLQVRLTCIKRPPFQATGAVETAINMAVFFALFLTPWYLPRLSFTSDAASIFYGASMLLAALRGYGGCEVLAISNWVLRRDDQVGCFVLGPVDNMERRLRPRSGSTPPTS